MNMLYALLAVAVILILSYYFAPKGWRTVVFNAISTVASVLIPTVSYLADFPWAQYLEPQVAVVLIVGINLANKWLRSITTSPVGKDL